MANNRYNYTWADALLAMDVSAEKAEKRDAYGDIEDLRDKEANRMALAGLLGMGLGSYFGPVGSAVGKNIGKKLVDEWYDWEGEAQKLDPGKFNQQETRDLMKDYSKKAREQTVGQAIGAGTDAAWAFQAAGGIEGLQAAKEADAPFWSTFGSSKDDPGGYTLKSLISEFGPVEGALAMTQIMEGNLSEGDMDAKDTAQANCELAGGTWNAETQTCEQSDWHAPLVEE